MKGQTKVARDKADLQRKGKNPEKKTFLGEGEEKGTRAQERRGLVLKQV